MDHRDHEEDVDNPPAPAPTATPTATPPALPQMPQGLPYYGAMPGYQMQPGVQPGQQVQHPGQLMMQQPGQPMMPHLQLPQLQQAVAGPYGGPSSPYQQPSPQWPAVAGPSSPMPHLQPQHGTPARGHRAPSTSHVTLPWEKRPCGRPNQTDAMMKKLYEEGRIAPPPSFHANSSGYPWQFFQPVPLQFAQPATPAFFPAAAAAASVPASVPAASSAAPAAAVASAAAGPSGGAQSSASSPRPECRYCRCETPDGFLKCGHALCRGCFARLKTNATECPDPRCNGSLDDESYIGIRL